jgi:16S rRNA (cytosine1402-N4)-methyltransferase
MTSLSVHVPILLDPIVQALTEPFLRLSESAEPHWIVDCTLGGGGHTTGFLESFFSRPELKKHRVLSVDQDQNAIERAQTRFKDEIQNGRLEITHRRFSEVGELIRTRPVLGLMADLGFSSDQLESSERGLSFQKPGPLDMRLDPTRGSSCKEFLAQVSESDLEEILREWGEERFSRRIASSIVYLRSQGRLPSTTQELVDAVVRAVPPNARHGRIHVATRTFQALRIAVNEELSELDELLDHVIPYVIPGGRVAILSFHSLEDRKVKLKFKDREKFLSLHKKPIQADEEEIRRNPRARSAKLRIAEVQLSK